MLKQQLKGCLMIVFMAIIGGFIAVVTKVSFYLFPGILTAVILSALFAATFAIIISTNIYLYTMKRYKVMAPIEPYEYKKMAQISYTKDVVERTIL